LYYSSNSLNEQACLGQFNITVQTVHQFSHFSTSSTQKCRPFGRQDNRNRIFFPAFSCLAFSASPRKQRCQGQTPSSMIKRFLLPAVNDDIQHWSPLTVQKI